MIHGEVTTKIGDTAAARRHVWAAGDSSVTGDDRLTHSQVACAENAAAVSPGTNPWAIVRSSIRTLTPLAMLKTRDAPPPLTGQIIGVGAVDPQVARDADLTGGQRDGPLRVMPELDRVRARVEVGIEDGLPKGTGPAVVSVRHPERCWGRCDIRAFDDGPAAVPAFLGHAGMSGQSEANESRLRESCGH